MPIYIYTSRWYVRNYVRIVFQGGDHSKKTIYFFLQIVPSNDLMVLVHHMFDVTQCIQQETCWVEIWHQNFLSRIKLTNTTVDSEMPQIDQKLYVYILLLLLLLLLLFLWLLYISLSLFLSLHGWLYTWHYLASFSSQDLQVISHVVQRPSIFGQVRFIWSKHLLRGRRETTEESPIWCGHSVFTQEPAADAGDDSEKQ